MTRGTVIMMIVGIEQLVLSPKRKNRRIPLVPLALSRQIKAYGQVDPVVVRPLSGSHYEILSQAETWLAIQRAGLHSVEIVVRDDLSDEEALEIINTAAELDPIAEAEWFESQLASAGSGGEFESIAALARSVGMTRSYVSHSLRLLTLGDTLKEALRTGALLTGHAKALLSIANPEQRVGLATRAIKMRWSVRKLESETRSVRNRYREKSHAQRKSPDVAVLERKITEVIGSRVEIEESEGKISIDYGKNLAVLDGILQKLGCQA